MKEFLKVISYLLYGFAILDFALGNFLGVDITGVSWSPIAAGGLASLLLWAGGNGEEEESYDNSEAPSGGVSDYSGHNAHNAVNNYDMHNNMAANKEKDTE
ncbi:MAG: hypothetical protein E6767_20335 [Dysgonomonas sp.]|nr:hypothetical protein [Dysgonomonas sp.]